MVSRIVLVLALSVAGACAGDGRHEQVRATLKKTVSSESRPPYLRADKEGTRIWKLTRQFYERRDFTPAWIDGTRPLPHIDKLIVALRAATAEGLDRQLYNVDLLAARRHEAGKGFLTKKGFDVAEAGTLDVWLTSLYMKYASDLADGLSDLAHADPRWHIAPEKFDPATHLEAALESGSVDRSLLQLTPDDSEYRELRDALDHYRRLAARDGWPALPARLTLKPGRQSPHVATLAARLSATGDYAAGVASSSSTARVYSSDLQDAVKRFQRRHGLADDGVVGRNVVAEMNVPIERRIRQIELNLERWRWLPRRLGERHILVNIPEYQLEVRDGGRVPLRMRVVVGKRETPTPIFDDEMSYVVFSPYWNVPPTIAEGETLPEVLRDPAFLERMNMEVLDEAGRTIEPLAIALTDPTKYRFRQRPGAQNSLGLVKFMFPNQHNIYLHDTPADSLFARTSRSFSHGCIRLERPLALAEYLLRDQPEWTRAAIEQAMHSGQERTVKLTAPIPVYLVYWTARAADGAIHFRKDVYGIDAEQTVRLAKRLGRLRRDAAKPPRLPTPAAVTTSRPAASN